MTKLNTEQKRQVQKALTTAQRQVQAIRERVAARTPTPPPAPPRTPPRTLTQPDTLIQKQSTLPTNQITIPRGATLSRLAQQHGTTTQAILDANPTYRGFLRDPRGNLIFAGDKLNIPTLAGTPTIPELEKQFVQEQVQKIPKDDFPLRKIEDEMRERIDEMRLPEPPRIADEFQRLRSEFGLESLEAQLSDVDRRIADTTSLYREQIEVEEDATIPLALIERRQSKLARQQRREMDSLNLERGVLVDQMNARVSAISNIMELKKWDYQTARQNYEWEFERQTSFYNSLINITGKEMDWNTKQRTNALANLNIHANALSEQGISWDNTSEELKSQMKEQAMRAGISPDILRHIVVPKSPEIKTQILGSATAGYSLISINEKTGEITNMRQIIPPVPRTAGGAGGDTSTNEIAEYYAELIMAGEMELENVPANIRNAVVRELTKVTGGTITGSTQAQQEWTQVISPLREQIRQQYIREVGTQRTQIGTSAQGGIGIKTPQRRGFWDFIRKESPKQQFSQTELQRRFKEKDIDDASLREYFKTLGADFDELNKTTPTPTRIRIEQETPETISPNEAQQWWK